MTEELEITEDQIDEAEAPKRTALVVRGFVSVIVYDPENYTDDVFECVESETAERGQRWTGTEFVDPVYRRQAQVQGGVVVNVCDAPEGYDAGDGSAFIPSGTAQIGDFYEDGVFTTPEPIPVEPPPPVARIVASGSYPVVDGQIDTLNVVSGITAAFAIDTGTYWLFFTEPQPDLSYVVTPGCSEGRINTTNRTTDYFELCVKDDGGALINPTEFSVNVVRTQ